MDLMIDGRVPIGAGLSSSAALECATALAAVALAGLDVDPAHLALLAQRAENEFVGVPCGVMDQMVSMLGRPGHVLFLDVRTGEREHVPFDPSASGLTLLVINTHASHAHAEGAYANRRQTAERIAARLGSGAAGHHRWAVASPRALADSPVEMRRLRHVVTEVARLAAVDVLRGGPLDDLARCSPPRTSLRRLRGQFTGARHRVAALDAGAPERA
jgi:galactokinase